MGKTLTSGEGPMTLVWEQVGIAGAKKDLEIMFVLQ